MNNLPNVREFLASWQCLSEEEKNVARLSMMGATNSKIARSQLLSNRTVDRRKKSVLQKMNVPEFFTLAYLVGKFEPFLERPLFGNSCSEPESQSSIYIDGCIAFENPPSIARSA